MTLEVPPCDRAPATGDPLDPVTAVAFVEHQACALRTALACPGDAEGASRITAAQAQAHEGWLTLIGAAANSGHPVLADRLASLYALHGRIGALLERGQYPDLDAAVASRVRVQLVAELHRRTADCVERTLALAPEPRVLADER